MAETELRRDCEAVQIPHGQTTMLTKGTTVNITQSLGGSYTVHALGGLYRISGENADALGIENEDENQAPSTDDPHAELTKAKEFAKGRLLLRLEDSRNVAGWIGGQEILTKRILSPDQLITIVEAITTEDLTKLARKLITATGIRLAVVGPVAKEEPIEKLLTL